MAILPVVLLLQGHFVKLKNLFACLKAALADELEPCMQHARSLGVFVLSQLSAVQCVCLLMPSRPVQHDKTTAAPGKKLQSSIIAAGRWPPSLPEPPKAVGCQ